MLPILLRIHLTVVGAISDRLSREDGQTSAEYALVLLGAAAVALLIVGWATHTNRVGKLLDSVLDTLRDKVK